MVEYAANLDTVFKSLGDPTRRDILRRLTLGDFTVSDIAQNYSVSLAAISKHLQVLERAKLIRKRKNGNEHIVGLSPATLKTAAQHLQYYQKFWESEFDALETYLESNKEKS